MTTYHQAGVHLEGAERHVAAIAPLVTATWGPHVVGGFGGFAAGVELPEGYRRPVLMMSTDGVGTKLELARRTGLWEGVGFDLVAMCVDDLAAVGAHPLAFVDYLAVGALDSPRDTAIVESTARACRSAGVALVGGETAEHPGVMDPGQVDLAGAALGVVERGEEITGEAIRPGDTVIGIASPNVRSNGFSLVRRVFEGADLGERVDGEATLGELLVAPSVIYSPAVAAAVESGDVRGMAHITGGGLPGNLVRPLPAGCRAVVDSTAWEVPAVFELIRERGGLDGDTMAGTFNMGIGFCLITAPDRVEALVEVLESHGHTAGAIGSVESGERGVELI